MEVRNVSAIGKNPTESVVIPQQSGSSIGELGAVESYVTNSELMHKSKYDLNVSEQAFRRAIEKANQALEGIQRRFEYKIHEKTGDVMIKVINQENNEVVREIPNEKFLDLMAKLQELVGLNIDEKR